MKTIHIFTGCLLYALLLLTGCVEDPIYTVQPTVTVTGSYVLYPGLSLGTLTPAGTAAFNGKTVEGTLAWKDASEIYQQAGEHQAAWVFTPDDPKHYLPVEGMVSINVAVSAIEWELVAQNIYPPLVNIGQRPVLNVLLSPDRTEYQMFCLKRPENGSYALQTAPVEDVTSWQQQTDGIVFLNILPGTLPVIVHLDQMIRFNDKLLVPEYQGQYRLFLSANDGIDWSQIEISGEKVAVQSILGVVGKTGYLTVVGGKTDRYFYRTTDLVTWERSENPVPNNFPEIKFARFTTPDDLTLVGGSIVVGLSKITLNTAWSTEDGLNWTRHDAAPFDEPREGASGAVCNGIFYLIGGANTDGQPTEDIRYSTDRGRTWHKVILPQGTSQGYSARSYASVMVDDQNRILIFSGRETSSSPWLYEVWRGTPK